MPIQKREQNFKENSKKIEVKIATNPVEKKAMYKADITANLYVFLKLNVIYTSNLYPTPFMVLKRSSPIFSLSFLI